MDVFNAIALADEQPDEYGDLLDLFMDIQGGNTDLIGLGGSTPALQALLQQQQQRTPTASVVTPPAPHPKLEPQQWLPPQQQQQRQQQQSAWMQQQQPVYQADQYLQQQQQQVSALLAAAQQQMNDAASCGVQAAGVLLQDAVNAASAHLSAWPMPAFGSAYAAGDLRAPSAGPVHPNMQQSGAGMKQEPAQQQQQQQQQQRRRPQPQLSAATLAKAAVLATQPADMVPVLDPSAAGAQPTCSACEVVREVATTGGASAALMLGASSAAPPMSHAGMLPPPGSVAAFGATPASAAAGPARTHQLLNWMMGLQQQGAQLQQVARPKKKPPAGLKDKVIALEAQLAERQAQLQAAELEHMALTAKHRALEQMVKSAGDDVNIMTDLLANLSVSSDPNKSNTQAKAAAEAAVAALQGQGGVQQPSMQPLQQRANANAAPVRMMPPPPPPPPPQQQQQQQQQQPTGMYSVLHRNELQELMDTPLEPLEFILQAPPAAAAAGCADDGRTAQQSPQLLQQQQQQQQPQQQQQQLRKPALFSLPSLEPFWKQIKATAAGELDADIGCGEGDGEEEEQQVLRDVYNSFSGSQEPSNITAAASGGDSATTSMSDGGILSGSGGGTSGGGGGEVSSWPAPAADAPHHPASAAAATAARAAAAGYGAGGLLPSGTAEQTQEMAGAASLVYPSGLLMPPRKQLEEKLPWIQALHKRLVLQLMPLLLQVQQERLQMQATAQLEAKQQQQQRPRQQQQQQRPRQQQQQASSAAAAEEPDSRESAGARYEGQLQQTPAMQELTRVMLGYSKDIHEFAIDNRMSTYELYTLNIETGVLGQPPPEGHWKRVADILKHRLSPQAVADLCVARQLYSSSVSRIKHGRQLLVLQLSRLLDRWSNRPLHQLLLTDAVHSAVEGPHGEGAALLDAIDSNMRREYASEGVYQWMTHAILPMHVLAELVVHSYPFKADIHMTLQELMRDEPMPELTAVQKLQLRQLQEQNQHLALQQQQAQRQQLAVMLARQQEEQQVAAAAALQALQQQRAMLALGQPLNVVSGSFSSSAAAPGSFSSLLAAAPGSFSSLGAPGSFFGPLAGGPFTAGAPPAAAGGLVQGGLMSPTHPLNPGSGWPPL